MFVNNEETGTSVKAINDHRADCPGADSNGGTIGVAHSTVVLHPCRKYATSLAIWLGNLCFATNASGWLDVSDERGHRAHVTRTALALRSPWTSKNALFARLKVDI